MSAGLVADARLNWSSALSAAIRARQWNSATRPGSTRTCGV